LKLIEDIKKDIKDTIKDEKLFVAFSGGLDSTVVALLAKDALGKEKTELVNVLWGANVYSKSVEAVLKFAYEADLKINFVDGELEQEKLVSFGPNCNQCTRGIKMAKVKEFALKNIVATGSNQCDSWGKTGIKLMNGLYAPLVNLEKKDINKILDYYGVKIQKIGENLEREGCKLKHLLKLAARNDYHIRAVSIANEVLIDILDCFEFKRTIANVKIIGPLSKNIALINVNPQPDEEIKKIIIEKLSTEKSINEIVWVDRPLKLVITATAGITNNVESRYWVLNGRLAPEFAFDVTAEWKATKNKKLKTFNVIDYSFL